MDWIKNVDFAISQFKKRGGQLSQGGAIALGTYTLLAPGESFPVPLAYLCQTDEAASYSLCVRPGKANLFSALDFIVLFSTNTNVFFSSRKHSNKESKKNLLPLRWGIVLENLSKSFDTLPVPVRIYYVHVFCSLVFCKLTKNRAKKGSELAHLSRCQDKANGQARKPHGFVLLIQCFASVQVALPKDPDPRFSY